MRADPEPRTAAELLGHRAAEGVGHVHIAALEGGRARRLVGNALEDHALDARGLAPVAVEGLQDQLDSGRERDDLVGAGAHGRLLEPVVAHSLDVLLRDDPAAARGGGAVEGHEVGPRFLEHEAHAPAVDDPDFLDLALEQRRGPTPVALEGELHVLGGDWITVVELGRPQHEVEGEPVRRHRPRLGQAGCHGPGGHRLHQGVVNRVEHHERRDRGFRLARIQPSGRHRDVSADRELSIGRAGGRRTSKHRAEHEQHHPCHQYSPRKSHGSPQGLVRVKPVTIASVLCAKRRPYTPSVDLSFPLLTSADRSYVPTTVPLIAHSTLSPFTDRAISCVTGCPWPAALFTAPWAVPRPFIWKEAGPKPRTMKLPLPYAAQYR